MFFLSLITLLDPIHGDFLDSLMQKYSDALYAITYNYLKDHGHESREDAEDLVQDSFLKVYININRFYELDSDETIKLLVIYTKNTVKDFLKKREHKYHKIPLTYEADGEELTLEIPDISSLPDEIVIDKDSIERMAAYIDDLSEEQRHTFLLRYHYGYTNREIAKILHISESNVGSKLYRAKQTLKKKMEGGYGE